jgi:hypothetical protein
MKLANHIMSHQAPKPKRAATYARRSSKPPHSSLGQQMGVIRQYAKQHDLEIVTTYSDGAKGGGA